MLPTEDNAQADVLTTGVADVDHGFMQSYAPRRRAAFCMQRSFIRQSRMERLGANGSTGEDASMLQISRRCTVDRPGKVEAFGIFEVRDVENMQIFPNARDMWVQVEEDG